MVDAVDPDTQARVTAGAADPAAVVQNLLDSAVRPIAANPQLRQRILELRRTHDRIIDEVSVDVLEDAYGVVDTSRARSIVESWRAYLDEHRDEITAIQLLTEARDRRISFADIKELAERIQRPPRNWTIDLIWAAHEAIEVDLVRHSDRHTLTDLVSLIRYTVGQDDELVPYAEKVRERYTGWLVQQKHAGVKFTETERWWLDRMVEVIAASAGIDPDDLDNAPFTERGGIDGAIRDLGPKRRHADRPTQHGVDCMTPTPNGWRIVRLAEVAETALGKMLDRGKSKGLPQVSYLRNVNVQWGRVDIGDVYTMELAGNERERFAVHEGDLLVCEGGEIGRAALWRGSGKYFAYQKAIHRVRSKGALHLPYLRYLLELYSRNGTLSRFSTGSTIAHLPQQKLRGLPIPLPSIEEQRRIVDILGRSSFRLDAAEAAMTIASKRSESLRRAAMDSAVGGCARLPSRADRPGRAGPVRRRPAGSRRGRCCSGGRRFRDQGQIQVNSKIRAFAQPARST